MNWLQKISQVDKLSLVCLGWSSTNYMDIGHQDTWFQNVILWNYDNNGIEEQDLRNMPPQWRDPTHGNRGQAWGRISMTSSQGSVVFDPKTSRVEQKVVLDALVNKYPGIRFQVFGSGASYTMQQYWEMLE